MRKINKQRIEEYNCELIIADSLVSKFDNLEIEEIENNKLG